MLIVTLKYSNKCLSVYLHSKYVGKKKKRDRETSYADIKGHNAAQKR